MREMIDRVTGKMSFKNRLISDDKVIVISYVMSKLKSLILIISLPADKDEALRNASRLQVWGLALPDFRHPLSTCLKSFRGQRNARRAAPAPRLFEAVLH